MGMLKYDSALSIIRSRASVSSRERSALIRTQDTQWAFLAELFQAGVQEEEQKKVGWEAVVLGNTLKILAYLDRAYSDCSAGILKAEKPELLDKVTAYIEEHYAEDITLSTLAESLSYEYHYLSRVLRKNFHIPFRTLLNQCRCDRAKEMITSTDLPLSVIANTCGFQSIRSFNRVFSEVTGATPTSTRKGNVII